jgi:DNA-binding beta-propeller fold protein YncE
MWSTSESRRGKNLIRGAALTLITVLLPACATGQGAVPPPDLVYVAVQGDAQVAVVDMATLEEVDRVDLQELGFSSNAKPHHVAVEPDGSHWYVSLIGENRILKFNRANELVDRAEFEVPGMMAVHPTRDLLLVGRSMSAVNPPQRVGVVERSGMDVEEVDVFFPRPHAIAVSADGTRLYTASLAVNQIGVVDLDTEDMELTDIPGEVHTLVQFAVSPDGRTVVATGQLTGRLLVFDMSDPDHPALRSQVEVGGQPWHPVFSPDGRTVYFGIKVDNAVVAVDVATGAVVWRTRDDGIVAPHGAALSPDGSRLFVSSNGPGGMDMGGGAMTDHADHPGTTTGTLAVLDTRDGTVLKVLEMGTNTTGVGVAAR